MEDLNIQLGKFRDIHKGQRAFVMANGPSLNKMDLSPLKGEIVFGANAGFLIYKKYDWRHKYYFCVDSRVVFDRLADLEKLAETNKEMICFLPEAVNVLKEDNTSERLSVESAIAKPRPNVTFFKMFPIGDQRVGQGLSENLIRGVTEPFTVTATMIEFAIYMGFSEIFLIGADTNYVINSSVEQRGGMGPEGIKSLLISTEADPNHFDASYFGPGRKWHAPNIKRMIAHYQRIKDLLPKGVQIWNAGIESKLKVFDLKPFSELF